MTPTFIADAVDRLTSTYGAEHIRLARDGQRTLVRIDAIELPVSCQPSVVPALLVLDPAQPRPTFYVVPGVLLPNGKAPASTSVQLVGGESWMQFSFSFPWDEARGIASFIAAARQRFGLDA